MYSVGIVLYELFTLPSTHMERIRNISNLREGKGESYEEVVDDSMKELVVKLVNEDSRGRPSASQVLDGHFSNKDLCLLEKDEERTALKHQVTLQQKQIEKQAQLIAEQEKEIAMLRNLLIKRVGFSAL